MKKLLFLTIILTLLLTACGSSAKNDNSAQFDPNAQELGLSTKLALGTLKLEGTDQAIASDQAADLLPLWQVLNSLSGSESASQAEVEALTQQIQDTLTPEQQTAIENMNLTRADIFATMQELGLITAQVNAEGTPQAGGFGDGQRPEGGFPGGGPGGGGGPGSFGGGEISPEQMATAQARRAANGGGMNTRLLTPLINAVIELLEAKVQ